MYLLVVLTCLLAFSGQSTDALSLQELNVYQHNFSHAKVQKEIFMLCVSNLRVMSVLYEAFAPQTTFLLYSVCFSYGHYLVIYCINFPEKNKTSMKHAHQAQKKCTTTLS